MVNDKLYLSVSDDASYINGMLAPSTTSILPFSKLVFFNSMTPGYYYHILMFDTTTNKDCTFVANIPSSNTTTLTLPATPTTTPGVRIVSVYNNGPSNTPPYKLNATAYSFNNLNTGAHQIAILVWQTPQNLTFIQTGTSTTQFNLNSTTGGDFAPSTATPGGAFSSVSALLTGKMWNILGQPWAGTFFYLTN